MKVTRCLRKDEEVIEVHIGYHPLSPQGVTLHTRAPDQDAVISEAIGALRDAGYVYHVPVPMGSYHDPGIGTVYYWMAPLLANAFTYENLSQVASLLWELLSPLPGYHVTFTGEHPEGWARGFFDEMN